MQLIQAPSAERGAVMEGGGLCGWGGGWQGVVTAVTRIAGDRGHGVRQDGLLYEGKAESIVQPSTL